LRFYFSQIFYFGVGELRRLDATAVVLRWRRPWGHPHQKYLVASKQPNVEVVAQSLIDFTSLFTTNSIAACALFPGLEPHLMPKIGSGLTIMV
jgi:hypothetical protein